VGGDNFNSTIIVRISKEKMSDGDFNLSADADSVFVQFFNRPNRFADYAI